jgi:hypothetical protein
METRVIDEFLATSRRYLALASDREAPFLPLSGIEPSADPDDVLFHAPLPEQSNLMEAT